MTKTRGQKRLCSVTYSELAEWSQLKLHTIRQYGARGDFDGKSVAELVLWANHRRAMLGLPLIGQPEAPGDPIPQIAEKPQPEIISVRPTLRPASTGGYNPRTGEYDA